VKSSGIRLTTSLLPTSGVTVHNFYVFKAYRWLLTHLVIAASVGYIATLLVAGLSQAEPATILNATRFGLPHVGMMITSKGIAFGIDEWFLIFFCNLTVAMLIVVLVYWAQLLNPHNHNRSFLRLRRHLQKDLSAELLRKIPIFARIQSPQLRLTSFLLLGVPYIATISIGLMVGALLAVGLVLSSSPLIALAYIMPHGIPEIAALLLACSIPVGIWMDIRSVANNENTSAAFRQIDRVLASQQFQQNLKMIVNLLLIAGLIESYLTVEVVAMLSGS
jgi:uncharacterized membrane protein SpoIIM required for sporulation